MHTFFLILVTSLLTSCTQTEKPQETVTPITGVAMTIPYRILIGKTLSDNERKDVRQLIQQSFADVDAIYNKYNPDSELSQLNDAQANTVVPISKKLTDILELAATVVTMSEGRFDPTMEPLEHLWQGRLEVQATPTEEEISQVLPSLGWNNIHYAEGQFWKDHHGTRIDLGGIAKGMCVDQLTELLVEAGYEDVYVDWGGEIRVSGQHPQGRPWTVFISRLGDPNPDNAIATLELKDQAIATSGDYQQQWSVAQTTYSHIIDPYAASPIQVGTDKIASVTVVAPNCTLADALATALMLFPTASEAKVWAEKLQMGHPDISVWILTREGQ